MKMYDGVLARVREMEEKYGIKYARTNGTLFKTLKVLYIISGIWMLIMNLFFVLGFWLTYSGTEYMSDALNSIITVSVSSVLIIIGFIILRFKLYIPSIILNIVPAAFLLAVFGNFLKDDLGFLGFKTSFYLRHFAPITLLIIFIIWLTAIALKEKYMTEKQYKKVTENLFDAFNVNSEEDITEEHWEEFLQNYNPADKVFYKKQFKETQEDEGQ